MASFSLWKDGATLTAKKGLLRKTEGFRIIELRVYNIFSVYAFLFFAVGIINFSMFGRFRYLARCITTALCKMLKYFSTNDSQ